MSHESLISVMAHSRVRSITPTETGLRGSWLTEGKPPVVWSAQLASTWQRYAQNKR